MLLASIKSLIAAEHADCSIIGRIQGIPRSYGSRRTEDICERAYVMANGKWAMHIARRQIWHEINNIIEQSHRNGSRV
jgi:hypothetical protein